MLQCSACERQQEKGKFCSSCGSALEEMAAQEEMGLDSGSEQETPPELNVEDNGENIAQLDSEEELGSSQTIDDTVEVEEDLSQHIEEQVTASQQEAAAVATHQAVDQQQAGADIQGNLKNYWEYSMELLKNPSKAFTHKDDKFVYGLINLGLYAFIFTLVFASYVRGSSEYQMAAEFEGVGALFVTIIIYLFIIMGLSLGVVLVSILAMEKMFIKKMSFKKIIVQYSGLLVPLLFIQAALLLFTFVGTSFFVLLIMSAVLFYGLFFLPGLFMYEKVMHYHASENKVYIAIGMTIFVFVALTIMSVIVGESLLNKVLSELPSFYDTW